MDDASGGEGAARARLSRALDRLEARLGSRDQANRQAASLQAEIEALTADRSRLAQELDRARARVARMETAAGHAETRVAAAMDRVRGLVEDA